MLSLFQRVLPWYHCRRQHILVGFSNIDNIENGTLLLQNPFDCKIDGVSFELTSVLVDLQANNLLISWYREGKLVEFPKLPTWCRVPETAYMMLSSRNCLPNVDFQKLLTWCPVPETAYMMLSSRNCLPDVEFPKLLTWCWVPET